MVKYFAKECKVRSGRCQRCQMPPNHQGWHAKWKLSRNMHALHTRFCTFGRRLVSSVGDYQQKFLHRSSGGSLLRVRCWLGFPLQWTLLIFFQLPDHPFARVPQPRVRQPPGAALPPPRPRPLLGAPGEPRPPAAQEEARVPQEPPPEPLLRECPTNIASVNLAMGCSKVFFSLF